MIRLGFLHLALKMLLYHIVVRDKISMAMLLTITTPKGVDNNVRLLGNQLLFKSRRKRVINRKLTATPKELGWAKEGIKLLYA